MMLMMMMPGEGATTHRFVVWRASVWLALPDIKGEPNIKVTAWNLRIYLFPVHSRQPSEYQDWDSLAAHTSPSIHSQTNQLSHLFHIIHHNCGIGTQ